MTDQDPNNETFKGLNDLVTRDPAAMEQAPQDAAYAGAAPTGDLGMAAAPILAAGMGMDRVVAADPLLEQAANPNADYTPPSQMAPIHQAEDSED